MAEASFAQICKKILELKESCESLNEKSNELKNEFNASIQENESLKAQIIAEMLNVARLKEEVANALEAISSSKENIEVHEQKIAEAMELSSSASNSINTASEQIAAALEVTKEAVELFVALGAELKDIVNGARVEIEEYGEPLKEEMINLANRLKDELEKDFAQNIKTQKEQIAVVDESIKKAKDIALSLDNHAFRYKRDYEMLGYKWDKVALNVVLLDAMLTNTQTKLTKE